MRLSHPESAVNTLHRLAGVALLGATLVAAVASAPVHAGKSCLVEYWLAPGGDDLATGDRAHPFRTLQRARDAVRADARRAQCRVQVTLRGGTYRLVEPLQLDARDSGAKGRDVVWRAARGERPVISGAVAVTGWSLHDAALGIHRAFVGMQRTRQLYVNEMRAVRARTEPYPADYERTATGYRFVTPGKPLPAWANAADIEAVTVTQWKMMRCPVATVIGAEVTMGERCWKNANVFQAPPGKAALWNFRLLSRFENAYEFLDRPGEWYLDSATGWLYYIPLPDEDLLQSVVELPVVEALIDGRGEPDRPIEHLRFEGLVFTYATWLGPSGPDGYAADQSGFHLVGDGHLPNVIGHDENVVRTPGNLRFRFARNVEFHGNEFLHLGGVGLDFGTGSQFNVIADNRFEDISSAGIQLGGVDREDHHPDRPEQVTRDNLVTNNLVHRVGREYFDAAGIYIGFTTRSTVSHNDIVDVPWSGIAIGWGWGLLDQGSFPGLPNAMPGEWGRYDTPSTSRGNRILSNRIKGFLNELWDGGAIYTQGAQGTSLLDGELIAWNVASGKRPAAGGNTFYTDGGSRYVTLFENVSYDNTVGTTDFGPCGLPAALPWCAIGESSIASGAIDGCSSLALCWLAIPYGGDSGGCVPHGDLLFVRNYWSSDTFSTLCSTALTVGIVHLDNRIITGIFEVPTRILRAAGRQPRFPRAD